MKGIFSENQYFSPSHPHLMLNKAYHWPFGLKKMLCACAHTPVTLCSVKEWGRGKGKNRETVL